MVTTSVSSTGSTKWCLVEVFVLVLGAATPSWSLAFQSSVTRMNQHQHRRAFTISNDQSYFSLSTVATTTTTTRMRMRTRITLDAKANDEDDSSEDEPEPYLGPTVELPDILNFDLTGGRPGAIIETEEQLMKKAEILEEIETGERKIPKYANDYGRLLEEEEATYDNDDPDAIDAGTLGQWDYYDLETRFEYEWDPEIDVDPNEIQDTTGFVQETEKDEEGIEVGYDPMFGPSNPIDTRTKTGIIDSYMIDDETRDDSMLPEQFPEGDLELDYNAEVVQLRKSLDIIETYVDEFLPESLPVPRHVAKWYGYPESLKYPPQNYTSNRFTEIGQLTNFDAMSPYDARRRAVELARAKNAEWLPDGISQAWHASERQPYDTVGTLVGSLRKGEIDPDLVEVIQPALRVLGSCAELLSVEQGTVYRFHYHGLIKNKHGMACWTETLLRDCGVEVTGVVFETGFRRRDHAYDGGDPYYGPHM